MLHASRTGLDHVRSHLSRSAESVEPSLDDPATGSFNPPAQPSRAVYGLLNLTQHHRNAGSVP
jgi:hypothetical protein